MSVEFSIQDKHSHSSAALHFTEFLSDSLRKKDNDHRYQGTAT